MSPVIDMAVLLVAAQLRLMVELPDIKRFFCELMFLNLSLGNGRGNSKQLSHIFRIYNVIPRPLSLRSGLREGVPQTAT